MKRVRAQSGLSLACTSLLFSILISGPLTCQAQDPQFQLRGKVLDQNHAAVAGARVTADLMSHGSAISATTNATGEFVLPLFSDKYVLTIVADGFTPAKQTVELNKDGLPSLEIVLEVAGTSESVTVLAAGGYLTDVIGSATKTLTAVRDVPQSISVVTKEQINDQLMLSIGDVVRYTPGLSVHQGENNRDQIIFRGQSSSADFFLNGVRDDVQYYRDLYNLERLETLKGPNAMIFGRGGGGGVINRVTKEAGFSPSREISVIAGSYFNRRIAGDFDQPLSDKIAFRLNSVYENSRSFRRFVNLHRFAINPTFSLVPSSTTRITFGYEYAGDRRTADRGITSFQGKPADVPLSTFYGDPDNSHVRSYVNLLYAAVEHQIGKLNIHNRTLFGDYDRFYQNYVPGAPNANKTLVILTAYNNATKRRNVFNQTDMNYVARSGRIKHTLLGGVELGLQLTDNFRNTGLFNNTITSISVPYSNPTTNTAITFRQNATDADNHLRTNLGAAYLQDQIEVSRYMQIVVGLRHDYFDLQYRNNRNGDSLRRIDYLVSPRLGVVLKPVETLSVYGSYSVSYLPSSGDQFSSLTVITEQIKPEKFTNFEVGVKWDLRRNLSFTSALYRLNRTNTRATDPNNPTAIVQTGGQRTNGFEMGISGSVTKRWSIAGGYAYQDASITSATTSAVAGKQVGQVPHQTLSLWNRYQLIPRLAIGLGVIARTDMFASVDNTVTLPGYARADAAVYYSFSERWRLQANIENFFNRSYYLNADGNTNISPGASRSLRLSLTARF